MKTLLEITGIKKSFGDEVVLDDIALRVHQSSILVLLGKSGSGKSTLLKCINQLVMPDQGMFSFQDLHFTCPHTLKGKDLLKLRRKVVIVFQEHGLWPHLSVLKNLILAPTKTKLLTKDDAIQKAKELLARFELGSKINALPNTLSGGQKQRISIARSLMMAPDMMMFDEPTSALDPLMTHEMVAIIQDLKASGLGIIISTHELDFANAVADEICFLHQGKIIESGSKNIIASPKTEVFAQFLQHSTKPTTKTIIGETNE